MCEKYMMDIFEKSAAEGFKDLDMVQLHCQVRKSDGRYVFCPSEETLKTCVARLNAVTVTWRKGLPHEEVYAVRPVYSVSGCEVVGAEASAIVTYARKGMIIVVQ